MAAPGTHGDFELSSFPEWAPPPPFATCPDTTHCVFCVSPGLCRMPICQRSVPARLCGGMCYPHWHASAMLAVRKLVFPTARPVLWVGILLWIVLSLWMTFTRKLLKNLSLYFPAPILLLCHHSKQCLFTRDGIPGLCMLGKDLFLCQRSPSVASAALELGFFCPGLSKSYNYSFLHLALGLNYDLVF